MAAVLRAIRPKPLGMPVLRDLSGMVIGLMVMVQWLLREMLWFKSPIARLCLLKRLRLVPARPWTLEIGTLPL